MFKLIGVNKEFNEQNEQLEVLRDVNYTFEDKGFYSIIGDSGSGKTTLLDIIGAIDEPTSGSIYYNGHDLKGMSMKERAKYLNETVSFVFQSNNLIDSLNVEENILLALSIRKTSKEKTLKKLEKLLSLLKISSKRYTKVKNLSGGEKQRVAIARALIKDSKVILADEPTGSLDENTSVGIMEILKSISEDHLVIMVTHNLELANKYSDYILKLKEKNIVQYFNKSQNNDDSINTLTTEQKVIRKKLPFKQKLKLIYTNFKARKGKTFIIGFALLMLVTIVSSTCLISDGFSNYLNDVNNLSFSKFPISIEQYVTNVDLLLNPSHNKEHNSDYVDNPENIAITQATGFFTKNNISNKLIDYINDINPKYKDNLIFTNGYSLDALVKDNYDNVNHVNIGSYTFSEMTFDKSRSCFNVLPEDKSLLKDDYVLIKGHEPRNKNEAILIVEQDHSLSEEFLTSFGLKNYIYKKDLQVDDFLGLTYKFIAQNDYYQQLDKYKLVDGIFFKREYELINEGLSLLTLYKLIESNIELVQSINEIEDLVENEEGIKFFKNLYPFIDKDKIYDLDNFDFNNKEDVENLFLSLITSRNLNCYRPRKGESLNKIYQNPDINEAQIVGVYKLNNDKLISSYAPGIYFDKQVLEESYRVNKPKWIDLDNDGKISNKEDKRSYILKSYESNFYLTYDGNLSMNIATIFDDIVVKQGGYETYFENVKSLGLIDYVSSIIFYPKDNSEKEYFLNYIDEFNKNTTNKVDEITLFDLSGASFSITLEVFTIITKILIIISILISLISIVLISVVLYDFINNEIKNIGIYMSLGIQKRDIQSVNLLEGVIMSILSTGLGISISYVFLIMMSNILKNSLNFFGGFTLLHLTPLIIFAITLSSFILIIILHFLPIFRINKLSIKEILRK